MIRAFHVNSTRPFFMENNNDYFIEDFEILTTVLSALMWRRLNGSIKLYTDNTGKKYYASLGLLDLWDDGINTAVVENIPESVNQQIFWAAAKIFALQAESTPIAMVDLDLIVWKNLSTELKGKQFAVIHREELHNNIYLSPDKLKTRSDYKFEPDWDWSELPYNMSFAYINNAIFKEYYTNSAIDFMIENNDYPEETVSQMVFAEQRIAAMCAKKTQTPVYHFLDDPYQINNNIFTHIWGAKTAAKNNSKDKTTLCIALLQKVKEHFPEYYKRLNELEMLKPYYNK